MLKKLLSSFWVRSVLPLAILPLAAYLEVVRHCWDSWPHLSRWASLEETNILFMRIFSGDILPYTCAVIATVIVLGILWHRSRGERRYGYWVLMYFLSVTRYHGAMSYYIRVSPPMKSIPPASSGAITVFWCAWVLAVLSLVVWDIRTRKIL